MTLLVGFLSSRRRVIARAGASTHDTGGLNAASPLGDDLLWAVVSGAHPRRDRAGGTDGQPDGAATLATDAAGFTALRSPGWGGSGWYWPAPAISGLEWTWQVRLRLDPPSGGEVSLSAFPKVLSVPYFEPPVWLAPFDFGLFLLPIDEHATTGQMRAGYAVDGSTRRVCTGPANFILLDGAEHTYAVRVRNAGTNGEVDWFRDGSLVGTTGFNGAHDTAPDLGAAPYLMALARHRLEPDEGLRATMPAAGLWNKALSDEQIVAFHADPWDLAEVATGPLVPAALHAWDDFVITEVGKTTRIHPLGNDSGAGLTIKSLTQPQAVEAGTEVAIVGGAGGTAIDVTVDEAEGDGFEFTYTVEDTGQNEGTATVHVAVFVPPPLGADNAYTLAAGETHAVSPLANDNAPDGSTIQSVTQPTGVEAGTSVAIAANETDLEITIDGAEEGSFDFTYTADGPGVSPWTPTVTVNIPAPTAPPADVNQDQPYAGLYYGNLMPSTGHGQIRYPGPNTADGGSTSFFWADRTDTITHCNIHWRFNNAEVYSNGDGGGPYTIEVIDGNPTTRLPASNPTVYSRLTGLNPVSKYGINLSTNGWRQRIEAFTQVFQGVQFGQPLCLRVVNNHANAGSNYMSSNNMCWFIYENDNKEPANHPYEIMSPARIIVGGQQRIWFPWPVSTDGSGHRWRRIGPPLQSVRYGNGKWGGPGAAFSSDSASIYRPELGPNDRIRERFEVSLGSRVVDRIYVWAWRRSIWTSGQARARLEAGPAHISNGNGTLIEEVSIPLTSVPAVNGTAHERREWSNGDKTPWTTFVLSQPRTLQDGQIYSLVFYTTGDPMVTPIAQRPESAGVPEASVFNDFATYKGVRDNYMPWLSWYDSIGVQLTSNGGSSWTFSGGSNNRRQVSSGFRCVLPS